MNGTSGTRRTRGGGCSSLLTLIFICCAFAVIYYWPKFVEVRGNSAPGAITEKRENVWIHLDDWNRRFEILAAFSVPGQPVKHLASCFVDERTYDSLHPGASVEVYYFPNLLMQPFIPATHISPCTSRALISLSPAVVRTLVFAAVTLLGILFLWRVLRIRAAGWLLAPWLCLVFGYVALPRSEPAPQQPVPATATINAVTTVTTILEGNDTRGIPLQHPFQIVQLKFVPPGMDTPVIAVDKVDAGSVPGLKEGESMPIIYDAARPRIARLQAGTRNFPGHALTTVLLVCVVFLVFILLMAVVSWFFKSIFRHPAVQAARANAALRRRRRF